MTALHDPTPARSASATASAPATATVASYDDTAEVLDLKRRLAAVRADRANRPEPTTANSPAPPPVAEPAAPKRADTPRRPPVVRQTIPAPRRPRPETPALAGPADGSRVAVVIAFALAQVGKPYVWAAAGPGAYDCSGLVMAAFARVGISLPHQTGGIIGRGRPVGRGELQPGDIVFPSSGHVGIYIGGGRMVHAPTPGDHVRVAPVYAFYTARRLL